MRCAMDPAPRHPFLAHKRLVSMTHHTHCRLLVTTGHYWSLYAADGHCQVLRCYPVARSSACLPWQGLNLRFSPVGRQVIDCSYLLNSADWLARRGDRDGRGKKVSRHTRLKHGSPNAFFYPRLLPLLKANLFARSPYYSVSPKILPHPGRRLISSTQYTRGFYTTL